MRFVFAGGWRRTFKMMQASFDAVSAADYLVVDAQAHFHTRCAETAPFSMGRTRRRHTAHTTKRARFREYTGHWKERLSMAACSLSPLRLSRLALTPPWARLMARRRCWAYYAIACHKTPTPLLRDAAAIACHFCRLFPSGPMF